MSEPLALPPIEPLGALAKPARALPRRFYTRAALRAIAPGSFELALDDRPALTKARRPLRVPDAALGAELLAEWEAQAETIDPATMPLTRLLHAAIDGVADRAAEVLSQTLRYAESDLVCYRATAPARLAALQAQHWDRVLDHARASYRASFEVTSGLMFIPQPPEAIAAMRARIEAERTPLGLGALNVLTTISGSVLIAVMVADGALSAPEGFAAGEVDAEYTASIWGRDQEAEHVRALRAVEFETSARVLRRLSNRKGPRA